MKVPTPMNDTARDDRFNRGLERLLHGDPTGIDEIDPDLQDTAIEMVKLANDAGWIGADPGDEVVRPRPWWRNGQRIINAVAAVLLVGMITVLATLGLRVWDSGDSQYGSDLTEIGLPQLGPGVCSRAPRTHAEIAAIVRKPEGDIQPFPNEGVKTEIRPWSLQITRDWNDCLISEQWSRALAYESEYFIWYIGWDLFPNGPGSLTDVEVANQVIDRHTTIAPIETVNGMDLTVYQIEHYRDGYGPNQDPRPDPGLLAGADAWIATVDENGDWIIWPTVVTIAWDGDEFVIVTTTQDGVPKSPYFRSDALNPEAVPEEP